jgi:uncharacterized protein
MGALPNLLIYQFTNSQFMINIGEINRLSAARRTDNGVYLTDEDRSGEVLLPNKYVPEDIAEGDVLEVFIFNDSEDRITATTATPKIKLHEFACLQVRDVTPVGAFLDWGLEKDLLVPFKEQPGRMKKGGWYMVFLYLDGETDRLVASGRYQKFLQKENITVKPGEEVNLIIDDPTDLGVNVIINHRFRGLIYQNELFQKIRRGDRLTGFIKNVREPNAEKILAELKASQGYLRLTDKSDPDDIAEVLEMSKKTFKKAVGALYKQRLIRLEKDGIYLV